MHEWRLKSPIALIIFNRRSTTERVFAEIAKAKPTKLFVIGDGPRFDRPEDTEKVCEARAIIDRVDWDCELVTNFSDRNLGCKERVVSGLNWVFELVDRAIILEDDVLPHQSFFRYCDELLDKYYNDTRIGLITGTNFIPVEDTRDAYSYMFTRVPNIPGWGTWARVWKSYDPDIKLWPEIRRLRILDDIFYRDPEAVCYWTELFEMTHLRSENLWDYQLVLHFLINNLVTIFPKNNLISNIGHGPDATNTKDPADKLANLPAIGISFPLVHPPYVVPSMTREKQLLRDVFGITTIGNRILRKCLRFSRFLWARNWVQLKREFNISLGWFVSNMRGILNINDKML